MNIIEDGNGYDYKASVDVNNRLTVLSTTQVENKFISDNDGQAYMFGTGGFIPITTTNTETGIFYLENTHTSKDLYITRIRTCANQIHKVQLYKNITGGTLYTDQTAGSKNNMNLRSANEAKANVYKGADGKTVSGGSLMAQHINNVGHSNDPFSDALIINRNSSIAITFELATAGDVCLMVVGYYQ